MRQTAGRAEIRVLLDDTLFMVLSSPNSSNAGAWQWVSTRQQLNSTVLALGTLTIVLTLEGESAGTAYFDDLCVSFSQPCKSIIISY